MFIALLHKIQRKKEQKRSAVKGFWGRAIKKDVKWGRGKVPESREKSYVSYEDGLELRAEDLCQFCDPSIFDFTTTAEVKIEDETIGQSRALEAIDFGLHIKSRGYNIFISGVPGTGKNSTVMKALHRIASSEPVPPDICYLYNFKKPESPRVVSFPAGMGRLFKEVMAGFVRDLGQEIEKAFSSGEYEKQKRVVMERFEDEREELNDQIQHYAESRGSELRQMLDGVAVVPRHDGHPITEDEYVHLPQEERESIKRVQREVGERLSEASRKIDRCQKQIEGEIKELDRKMVMKAVGNHIESIRERFGGYGEISLYLDELLDDIVANLGVFKKEEGSEPLFPGMEQDPELTLQRYAVNLLVDNSELSGAPVVVEKSPTFYNLNGFVEYRMQMGAFTTDYTMIRPGAVHRANGGYLVLEAEQVLRDPMAWDCVKKILRYGEVKIENIGERYGFVPAEGLKPQPFQVNVKVIVIGNPWLFQMLYVYDEEFVKLFKVKADFDESLERSGTMVRQFVSFIARVCRDENLHHCSAEAVARIIDHASRSAEHKEKLSAELVKTADILREADYWATKEKSGFIEGRHVKLAYKQRCYRCNIVEEKIQELIEENTIIIDSSGKETGQVNGVSVIDMGDYIFGKPSRITAKTYVGPGNIINIEREAEMSGRIHSKGVLILSGYLGQTYAQDKPLAMSASICFEQHYEEIEGDSASSAELYCLLSSLSGLPLRQDLAVTGSVDQGGRIQPVGGINQKLEGFFRTCRIKGLTGTQGVIIPHSNIRHLMLDDEVVKAVGEGIFHIYPVKTIDEGLRILTGVEPGIRRANGEFPRGTVHFLVNQKLRKIASVAATFEREGKEFSE